MSWQNGAGCSLLAEVIVPDVNPVEDEEMEESLPSATERPREEELIVPERLEATQDDDDEARGEAG